LAQKVTHARHGAIGGHNPEPQAPEQAPAPPDPLVRGDDASISLKCDRHCDRDEQREGEGDQQHGDREIKRPACGVAAPAGAALDWQLEYSRRANVRATARHRTIRH
jgi:hypothetical protein